MSLRKSNRVVHIPKCIMCPRDMPSFHGECFVAIPSNVNDNGKWLRSSWFLYCGKCFDEIIKQLYKDKKLTIKEIPLEEIDFMNLFKDIPITIFKEKYQYSRIEFKQY